MALLSDTATGKLCLFSELTLVSDVFFSYNDKMIIMDSCCDVVFYTTLEK